MLEMIRKGIFGAVRAYLSEQTGGFDFEKKLSEEIGKLGDELYLAAKRLEETLAAVDNCQSSEERLSLSSAGLVSAMAECRKRIDRLEQLIDSRFWPYPTYTDLMFSV